MHCKSIPLLLRLYCLSFSKALAGSRGAEKYAQDNSFPVSEDPDWLWQDWRNELDTTSPFEPNEDSVAWAPGLHDTAEWANEDALLYQAEYLRDPPQIQADTCHSTQIGNASDRTSFRHSATEEFPTDNAIPKRKTRYTSADRIYMYAKQRMPLQDRQQWDALLLGSDPKAIDLVIAFNAENNARSKKARLKKKLDEDPFNPVTAEKMISMGHDLEEIHRQRMAKERRKDIAYAKRLRIEHLLVDVCEDIQLFNERGQLRRKYDGSARQAEARKRVAVNLSQGDAEAEEVIDCLRKVRSLFQADPFSVELKPLVDKINKWLFEVRHNYLQIILPTRDKNV